MVRVAASHPDTVPKNCPFEAVALRMRAASPHSFSSCRLGNGKGGLTAGGKERRGTRRNHMSVPHLDTSVFGFTACTRTQSRRVSNWALLELISGFIERESVSVTDATSTPRGAELAASTKLTLLSSMYGGRQWGRRAGMEPTV